MVETAAPVAAAGVTPPAMQFTVTTDYQRTKETELTVRAGEVLSSGAEAKYEQNGWRLVWRPVAPDMQGYVPLAVLAEDSKCTQAILTTSRFTEI